MKRGVAIFLLLALAGCKRFPNPFEGERVLARAGKETLRQMDLEAVVPVDITGDDSVKWVENYVDRWVRDNLKLQEATALFGDKAADEELVRVYRNSLITRRLDEYFIKQAIGDSLYTQRDLRDYYDNHKSEFILNRNIVKGRVVAFRIGFRQESRLRELFASWTPASAAEVQVLASKNGFALKEVTAWMEWPEFLALLPTMRNASYDNFLTRGGVQEMREDGMKYLFVVDSKRVPGDVTPYEMVSEIVRQSVATRRRAEIVKASEDSIYAQAMREKKAVINL